MNSPIVRRSPLKMIMVPSVGFFIVAQRALLHREGDFIKWIKKEAETIGWEFCFETTEMRRLS